MWWKIEYYILVVLDVILLGMINTLDFILAKTYSIKRWAKRNRSL